jgi:AcrR family transcriptional regulator
MAATNTRDRFRAQVRDEVKQAALRQLAEGGAQALSVNAIGRELGVSGPALYRYFASRDDLLTALVADAYDDFAAALTAAAHRTRRQRTSRRLHAVAVAYREWALAQPHRYRLLFAAPVPGYDAHSHPLVAAAQRSMDVLLDILANLVPPSSPLPAPTSRELSGQLDQWAQARGRTQTAPAVALRGITAWTRLHGLITLEIEGNFASMGLDPALLYEAEVAILAG